MTEHEFTAIRQALECQHGASVKPIVVRGDSKAVFLLDEIHNHSNLIDDNIRMAKTLIQLAGKTVVGVEGCAGDKITLGDLMCPSESGRCFGGRPRFALAMLKENQVEIVGADSRELCQEIEEDCQQNKSTAAQHPKQELRSAHMAQTLIEKLLSRCGFRAAVLSAGARHNDDIEQIVRGAKPLNIGAEGASFARIRSALFPSK